jgi:CubicO group peptidase (beta-lactamase class C family)
MTTPALEDGTRTIAARKPGFAPAGGIDANVDEMSRYALLQLDDGTMLGRRVLSAQMMAELHRPEITVGADWTTVARIQNLHYALGWFTADVRGVHLVSHNGGAPGVRWNERCQQSMKVVVWVSSEWNRRHDERANPCGPYRPLSVKTGQQMQTLD